MGPIATIQQFTKELCLNCNSLINTGAGATDIMLFPTEEEVTYRTPSWPQQNIQIWKSRKKEKIQNKPYYIIYTVCLSQKNTH